MTSKSLAFTSLVSITACCYTTLDSHIVDLVDGILLDDIPDFLDLW